MNAIRLSALFLFASLPLAASCSQQSVPAPGPAPTATADAAPKTMIGKTIAREIRKAREELRAGNISLNRDNINVNGKHYGRKHDNDNRSKAEITPKGDLLVDGKAVAVTPGQRAMLLDYRGQIIGIAEIGMSLGSKGAELAGTAIKESLGALFSGDTDEVERRVEAEAGKLKAEAMLICQKLPPMLATQQKLAVSLPEFKPYATMTRHDVDDCADEIDHEGVWSTQ